MGDGRTAIVSEMTVSTVRNALAQSFASLGLADLAFFELESVAER